eukprot:1131782-Pleurochrysis_carterae.AAC.1
MTCASTLRRATAPVLMRYAFAIIGQPTTSPPSCQGAVKESLLPVLCWVLPGKWIPFNVAEQDLHDAATALGGEGPSRLHFHREDSHGPTEARRGWRFGRSAHGGHPGLGGRAA